MKKVYLLFTALFLLSTVTAQVKWQRQSSTEEDLKLRLFHSTYSVHLPTTETLDKGEFEFEVSHRFIPTIQSGSKDLWGFDGPVTNRLALGYAVTDQTMITFGRSNLDDNLDLWVKQRVFEYNDDTLPFVIALKGGAAWATDNPLRESSDSRSFQFYGQLIFNTMYDKKLGFGLVPSYLYNSHIECKDVQYSFTLGTYAQYYLSEMFSLMFEWNPTVTGWRQYHNPVSFGLEVETGGHFFKVTLSNSSDLNPSQFLAGADKAFSDGDLRFGFMITRLLVF